MKKAIGNYSVSLVLLLAAIMTVSLISCGSEESDSSNPGPVGGHSTTAVVQNVDCTPDAVPVAMQNSHFDPYNAQAPVNSIIKWTNYDAIAHRVTSARTPDGGVFESDYIGKGDFVCFRFTGEGEYRYYCSNHMDGIVTITTPTT